MNAKCKLCGAPLKKGNIKIVRPRGKKRPWRECRRCPEPKALPSPPQAFIDELAPKREVFTGKPDHGETHSWKDDTGGNGLQRPQDTADAVVTVEGVFGYSEPPRYRFFLTPDQAERVKRVLDKPIYQGFGIGLELITVPEDEVERDPETFGNLVEVTIDWKGE